MIGRGVVQLGRRWPSRSHRVSKCRAEREFILCFNRGGHLRLLDASGRRLVQNGSGPYNQMNRYERMHVGGGFTRYVTFD